MIPAFLLTSNFLILQKSAKMLILFHFMSIIKLNVPSGAAVAGDFRNRRRCYGNQKEGSVYCTMGKL